APRGPRRETMTRLTIDLREEWRAEVLDVLAEGGRRPDNGDKGLLALLAEALDAVSGAQADAKRVAVETRGAAPSTSEPPAQKADRGEGDLGYGRCEGCGAALRWWSWFRGHDRCAECRDA